MEKDKSIKELDEWLEKSQDDDFPELNNEQISSRNILDDLVNINLDSHSTFKIDFSYKRNGVQDSILMKLKRLDCHKITSEIDLHGYDVKTALIKLNTFINYAYKSEIKYIKVICGKGINSKDGIPKLNILTQEYIKKSKIINAACVSREADGGYGVIKVLLKSY